MRVLVLHRSVAMHVRVGLGHGPLVVMLVMLVM